MNCLAQAQALALQSLALLGGLLEAEATHGDGANQRSACEPNRPIFGSVSRIDFSPASPLARRGEEGEIEACRGDRWFDQALQKV